LLGLAAGIMLILLGFSYLGWALFFAWWWTTWVFTEPFER
jgi:hypothetical protein